MEISELIGSFVGLVVVFISLIMSCVAYQRFKFRRFPSPPTGLIMGNESSSVLRSHLACHALTKTLGPIFRLIHPLGFNTNIVICDHECAREMFANQKSFKTRISSKPGSGMSSMVSQGLLCLPTNKVWQMHRRLISPLFSNNFLKTYAPVISEKAELLVNYFDKELKENVHNDVDVQVGLVICAMDVIGSCGFGKEFNSLESALNDKESPFVRAGEIVLTEVVLRHVLPKCLWPVSSWLHGFKEAENSFLSIVDKLMNNSKNTTKEDPKNMLSALVLARDPETNQPLTTTELEHELVSLLLAGHETTAHTISWALYLLAQNPEIQTELRKQIIELDSFGYDLYKEVPLMEQVCSETLRIFPTVPTVGRLAEEDAMIKGYDIPRGTGVKCSIWALHRDPKIWKNPEDFVPARFDELSEHYVEVDQYMYAPFGFGKRKCIGYRFAQMEFALLLAPLLKSFSFSMPKTHTDPVDHINIVTLQSHNKIYLELTRLEE